MTRCAVYTRKSSEEGLEQDFNSLDAQREAAEAYIKSQRSEGWRLLKTRYDDGGFSGANLERPAVRKLLADIEAGRIDVVIVYKIDRLTRSLTDFARLIERFDAQGVSVVAVTQPFNTTTSMGRLTLNVLLSFAQFEREITGERIRDKIAASKRKGMWMGGTVPLGYDVVDRALVVNEAEAETVRFMFTQYLELGSVRRLKSALDTRGIVSKRRISVQGKKTGGVPMSRGALYTLLQNPLYVGCVRHKGTVYPGQHPAIVETPLFERAQAQITEHRRRYGATTCDPSLLAGLLFDGDGERMTPARTARHGRRYRYYVSRPTGTRASTSRRLPAQALEDAVVGALVERFSAPAAFELGLDPIHAARRTKDLVARLEDRTHPEHGTRVRALVERVVVNEHSLTLKVSASGLLEALGIDEIDPPPHLEWTLPLQVVWSQRGKFAPVRQT